MISAKNCCFSNFDSINCSTKIVVGLKSRNGLWLLFTYGLYGPLFSQTVQIRCNRKIAVTFLTCSTSDLLYVLYVITNTLIFIFHKKLAYEMAWELTEFSQICFFLCRINYIFRNEMWKFIKCFFRAATAVYCSRSVRRKTWWKLCCCESIWYGDNAEINLCKPY